MLQHLLGEKSLSQDLDFVELAQMPEDSSGLMRLSELQLYIDKWNTENRKN